MLIGHRGTPREHQENSLVGFLRALELGAGGLELDVHATSDGVAVVHHDAALEAGVSPIATLTHERLLEEAARLGKEVPTLAAVAELVAGRAELFVEIKGIGIHEGVARLLLASPARHRCAIHSFDHRATAGARAVAPAIPGGILLASYLVDTLGAMRAADSRDLWMWWEMIDAALVEGVHDSGGRVIAWTVNNAEAAVELARMGVDGLCTDDLPLIRSALERAHPQ
jgi:glycerophosphoryl diester phosphodiesterase